MTNVFLVINITNMIELEFENNLICDLDLAEYNGEEYSIIPYLEEPVSYQHFFRAHLVRWKSVLLFFALASLHLAVLSRNFLALGCFLTYLGLLCTWLFLVLGCSMYIAVFFTWSFLARGWYLHIPKLYYTWQFLTFGQTLYLAKLTLYFMPILTLCRSLHLANPYTWPILTLVQSLHRKNS